MGRRWRRIEGLFFYRYVLDEGDVGIMLIYLPYLHLIAMTVTEMK